MSLSRHDVEKVSLLARLLLTSEELDLMTSQLGSVVAYIEQLADLDQEIAEKNVSPMVHAVEINNVFRADLTQPSLERAAALANAPEHDEECYRVPAVLGE